MKAYQYEIESRLIKMLMCLCVVLSFAGCNSDEEIEGDPYAGGKEPYGIRFLVDAPSPDRAAWSSPCPVYHARRSSARLCHTHTQTPA